MDKVRKPSSSVCYTPSSEHNIKSSNLIEVHQHFGGIYCLQPQDQGVSRVIQNSQLTSYFGFGRAIAQAVGLRFPTAAARVQTRVWSCGIL
jgi:hypothetical protein